MLAPSLRRRQAGLGARPPPARWTLAAGLWASAGLGVAALVAELGKQEQQDCQSGKLAGVRQSK
jgi:hypothetical protein